MFAEIKCQYCNRYFNNSSGIIIQKNKITNKMQCMDCAEKEYFEAENEKDNTLKTKKNIG
jgi:hypothetical protein